MASSGAPRPRQHVVGDFGERFVASALPDSWVLHSYKGSEDYGIDFHVEIFSSGKPTGLEFGVQVKTVERFQDSLTPTTVVLTLNNLLYMASKPYPCMVIVVSYSQKSAKFAWIGELFRPEELISHLKKRSGKKTKNIHVPLRPNHDLENNSTKIEDYLREINRRFVVWFDDESNRRAVTDLYFDIHSSLDAIIDCILLIHSRDRTDNEISHKGTYTVILAMTSYALLYSMTRKPNIEKLGPVGPVFLAIQRQFRQALMPVISDQHLTEYENYSGPEDLIILPGNFTNFWPTAPRIAILLRDALRTISRIIAPWRDFNKGVSGLSSLVIDYRPVERPFPTGEDENSNQSVSGL